MSPLFYLRQSEIYFARRPSVSAVGDLVVLDVIDPTDTFFIDRGSIFI